MSRDTAPCAPRPADAANRPLRFAVVGAGMADSHVRFGREVTRCVFQGGRLAISVPGFPNLFLLNGPDSPVGNSSVIDVAERQVDCVLQLVERVRSGAGREISASHEAIRGPRGGALPTLTVLERTNG